jgi:hypothetical protein
VNAPCLVAGRDANFIRSSGEEIPMPVAMPVSDLKRTPPFGELGRNFEVECPVHGPEDTARDWTPHYDHSQEIQ